MSAKNMLLSEKYVLHTNQREKQITWLLNYLFYSDNGYAVDFVALYPEGVAYCFAAGWLRTSVDNGSELLTITNHGLSELDQRLERYEDFYFILGQDPAIQDEDALDRQLESHEGFYEFRTKAPIEEDEYDDDGQPILLTENPNYWGFVGY